MFYIIYAKHGTKPVLTRAEAVVKTNRGGWVDADWAGDIDTRRSHTGTGYILILNGGSISWKSLRPNNVSREVGGWGRVPFSRNLMKPTPCRKWYLTTGRMFH